MDTWTRPEGLDAAHVMWSPQHSTDSDDAATPQQPARRLRRPRPPAAVRPAERSMLGPPRRGLDAVPEDGAAPTSNGLNRWS